MKPTRAKLFQKGSRAVRLPKECRFVAQREDEWSEEFRSGLGSWSASIPRPKQQKITDLRNPFA
jgi:hypothetical protein